MIYYTGDKKFTALNIPRQSLRLPLVEGRLEAR